MLALRRAALAVLVLLCYVVGTLCLTVLAIVGVALTWLYQRKGWPDEKTAVNCWAFAIPKWLHAGTFRSHLLIRSSEYAKIVPHVQFAPGPLTQYIEEFQPTSPRTGWRGVLAAFWHKGRIRKGEGEE